MSKLLLLYQRMSQHQLQKQQLSIRQQSYLLELWPQPQSNQLMQSLMLKRTMRQNQAQSR